jgi:hypothetical protein
VGQTWGGVKLFPILIKIFKKFKKKKYYTDMIIDVTKVTIFSRNNQKDMTINVVTLSATEQQTVKRDDSLRVDHNFFTKHTVGHDGGCGNSRSVFTISRQWDIVTDCWHPTQGLSNHIESVLIAHSSEAGILATED